MVPIIRCASEPTLNGISVLCAVGLMQRPIAIFLTRTFKTAALDVGKYSVFFLLFTEANASALPVYCNRSHSGRKSHEQLFESRARRDG